ncbi:MAG: NUDIX domain-containing protein [Candidatus Paceibacterota bacterium]|jgi:8-oxo-dGTP diphosphatase
MIEVAKALIIKDKKYLLLKRSPDSKFFAGQWDFPGGKLELGEGVLPGLIRESFEETNLLIEPSEKVGDFNSSENDRDIHFQIFSTKNFSGEIRLSNDHTDFSWAGKEEAMNYDITPVVRLYFESR